MDLLLGQQQLIYHLRNIYSIILFPNTVWQLLNSKKEVVGLLH